MKSVVVHSDGACRGNPGPGGWAAVLTYGTQRKELSGGVPATTNNRMELHAAIEALSSLKLPCAVEFFTDSKYVQNGISQWVAGWKRNGWRTQARQPVKNADLWRALDAVAAKHQIQWKWLKGHAGHEENERCDVLANAAIDRIMADFPRGQLAARLAEFVAASAGEAGPVLL
jgi:ribonuclease HI